jgi:acyl-CoA reductase-like NAD-dependent aldehyde dehydrogenase
MNDINQPKTISKTLLPILGNDMVVFQSVDEAVNVATLAQEVFQDHGLEVRRAVIKAMREVSKANAARWATMAVEETGMGRVDDKNTKKPVVRQSDSRC